MSNASTQTAPAVPKSAPPRPPAAAIARFTGITLVMLAALAVVGWLTGLAVFNPPIAASAVIVAATPLLPAAQPRSVVVGQLASAVVGYLLALLGHSVWVAAVAGALALTVMLALRAMHAPAAATAALIVASHPPALDFLAALLIGGVIVVALGVLAARLPKSPTYPGYWW